MQPTAGRLVLENPKNIAFAAQLTRALADRSDLHHRSRIMSFFTPDSTGEMCNHKQKTNIPSLYQSYFKSSYKV